MAIVSKANKPCFLCRTPIDVDAKKCPHCWAFQARWKNLEGSPWGAGAFLLMILGVFGSAAYGALTRPVFETHAAALTAEASRIDVIETPKGPQVSCLVRIRNATEHRWRDFSFEVRLLDTNGVLVDTYTARERNLLVPAKGDANLRVRGPASLDAGAYTRCEPVVQDAHIGS